MKLGKACVLEGKLDQSILYFNQVLAIDPSYVLALSNRATVYSKKREINAALKDFNRVIELKPNLPEGW